MSPELKQLVTNQFVPVDTFLAITNGTSLGEVKQQIGSAVRHQFTVWHDEHTWTLIRSFIHTGEDEGYVFYQLLFRDDVLLKTIDSFRMETEEYPYEGTTATRIKSWDIEDMKYVKKAIEAPSVTPEQIRARIRSARDTMDAHKKDGNIPAIVGHIFARNFLARAEKGYPANEKLREKFDGCRASCGMTIREVDLLYSEPLHTFTTKNRNLARVYGDNRYLGNAVDSFLVFPYVAVLFEEEKAVAIYSDGFFCNAWYPDMPSWRR